MLGLGGCISGACRGLCGSCSGHKAVYLEQKKIGLMNFEKDKKGAFLPKDPEHCSPSVPRGTRSRAVGWWQLFMQWAEQRTELVLFCLNAAQKAVKISVFQ